MRLGISLVLVDGLILRLGKRAVALLQDLVDILIVKVDVVLPNGDLVDARLELAKGGVDIREALCWDRRLLHLQRRQEPSLQHTVLCIGGSQRQHGASHNGTRCQRSRYPTHRLPDPSSIVD